MDGLGPWGAEKGGNQVGTRTNFQHGNVAHEHTPNKSSILAQPPPSSQSEIHQSFWYLQGQRENLYARKGLQDFQGGVKKSTTLAMEAGGRRQGEGAAST